MDEECTAWVNAKDPDQVRYSQLELVRQHIYGLAMGYVHQDDHDALAHDAAAKMAVWDHSGRHHMCPEYIDHRIDQVRTTIMILMSP